MNEMEKNYEEKYIVEKVSNTLLKLLAQAHRRSERVALPRQQGHVGHRQVLLDEQGEHQARPQSHQVD